MLTISSKSSLKEGGGKAILRLLGCIIASLQCLDIPFAYFESYDCINNMFCTICPRVDVP